MLGKVLSRIHIRIMIAQLLLYLQWNLTLRWNLRRRDLFLEGIFSILGRLARAESVPSPDAVKTIDDFARFLLAPAIQLQVSALKYVRQKCEGEEGANGIESSDTDSAREDYIFKSHIEAISLLIFPGITREALLDVMISVALAGECINPTQENLLRAAAAHWGIPGSRYLSMLAYKEELAYEEQLREEERLEEIYRKSEETYRQSHSDSPLLWAYEELDLKCSSPFTEVRRSYRRLAMKYHPDKYPSGSEEQSEANERFKRIQKAYEAISDARQ